jgi:hypothetical protein
MDNRLDDAAIDAAAEAQYEHDIQALMSSAGPWMKRHHYPAWRDARPEDKQLYCAMARRIITEYLANVRR